MRRLFHGLGVFIRGICIFVGALVLFAIGVGIWSAKHIEKPTASLPDKMVLVLRLEDGFAEKHGAGDYLSQLGLSEDKLTVRETVDALDRAAADRRIKAFVLSLKATTFELAQLQEVRAAVMRFKKSGKPTFIYAPSYGEGGSGLGSYYLASAFDQIWMQPVGMVSIAGLNAQMPFFKGILNKYGVEPQFFQRKEYKTAMESFTSTEMSPASREQMTALINDMGDQIVAQVNTDRKKVAGTFRALIDQGLFTDQEALKAGLIDRLDYSDVMSEELKRSKEGANAELVDLGDFAAEQSGKTSAHKIALIVIQGMITEDGSGSPYQLESKGVNANELAQTIRDAANDKSIKAIILRVDSPGGTPSASETIRRAIVWAKEKKNKRVIVSMGSTAASGAYWLSANADKIYADAGTLTGSIGVVGGKFDTSGLWQKFDVNWDGVNYGKNSGIWSMSHGFNASEQERFEASLDSVYNNFVSIVANGRKLKPEQVEQIARGRVWTGRQAKDVKLVDQIGGLDMTLDDFAKSIGLKNRGQLAVVEMPKPENPLEALVSMAKKKKPFGTDLGDTPYAALLSQLGDYAPFLIYRNQPLVYSPSPKF